MNGQHFLAFLWLRWRIRLNQLKRAGIATVVVLIVLAPFVVFVPVVLFTALFLVGLYVLPEAPAGVVMLVWDALVVGFLFAWATGLMVELQRSEVLSLEKFLHLPVSLKGVFLINYFSSLVSLNMVIFLPAMLGLCLGMTADRGPAMLAVLPLLAAFLLMVTALSYQFQGWLASLMVNKRRRRTIIVVVTMCFILLVQVPNLLNFMRPWGNDRGRPGPTINREQRDLEEKELLEQVERIGGIINLCLPIGWLPLGAEAAAQGSVWQAFLGTLALGFIGAVSLRRAYGTTLRLYTGQYTAGKGSRIASEPPPKPKPLEPANPASMAMLEKQLPWLSEQAAAIALSGFRGLLRAPEAKMMLLTPVIMLGLFAVMLMANRFEPSDFLRPLMAFGGMSMVLVGMVQLLGNQFGFDRSGFRVFVLCAAPRREILLGKNMAFLPLVLGLAGPMAILMEAVRPMRVTHFLALWPQLISMYLLLCLAANLLSIVAPMPIASGSLKPASPKLIPFLLHLLFVFALPITLGPTLLPLLIEFVLEEMDVVKGVPICLFLSVVECALVVFLYRWVLNWEGWFLHSREQRILETVASKAE